MPGKNWFLNLVTLALFWLSSLAVANEAPYGLDLGRYHALVITNQQYDKLTPLKTPHGDGDALASILRRDYGFKVTQLRDANRGMTLDALDRLVERLTPSDNLLIFYAGHGHLDPATGEGYWLPVTANPKRRSEWISNSDVTDTLRATVAQHVLVISDSCFSGTLSRNAGAGLKVGLDKKSYYKKIASRKSRTSLSSGGLEPVDDGGAKGHSVFAGALIDALSRNDEALLEGETLYNAIKRPVALNSSATQKPMYSDVRTTGHDDGDFLFHRRGVKPKVAAPAVVTKVEDSPKQGIDTSAAYELTFWNSIKDSQDAQDFAAYLDSYPNGQFAGLAKLRVKKLSRKTKPQPVAPPVVISAVAPPRNIKPAPSKKKPTLVGGEVVLLVRATPEQEHSPEFSDIKTYSTAIAGLVQKYYSSQSMKVIVEEKMTSAFIYEGDDYNVSDGICEKYAARIIYSVELDMTREIEELTRTPDEVFIGIFDCNKKTKVIKTFPVNFQRGEAFTYASSVENSINVFERIISPFSTSR